MAFRGDQRSQVVHRHRDPLPAYAPPNVDPENMAGSTYRSLAIYLLSEH